jgi:hypothetical protein
VTGRWRLLCSAVFVFCLFIYFAIYPITAVQILTLKTRQAAGACVLGLSVLV